MMVRDGLCCGRFKVMVHRMDNFPFTGYYIHMSQSQCVIMIDRNGTI